MDKKKLDFSIIIPTYMRPKALSTCLSSICDLEYPKDKFEVIVVDDGGTLPIEKTIELFTSRINIKLFRQENAGPGVARNFGARKAEGRFLAFTDDDCEVDQSWLTVFGNFFKKDPSKLVGGKTINKLDEKLFSATSQLIVDVVYQGYNPNPNRSQFFASNNIAVDRESYLKLGGFDPSFRVASEDRDFCYRWLQSNRGMVYLEAATIYHSHHLNLKSFFRQHFRYGCGAFRYYKMKKVRKWSDSAKLQPFIYFHMSPFFWLRYLFTRYSLIKVIRISFALIIWQMANSFGFLWELITDSCRRNSGYTPY